MLKWMFLFWPALSGAQTSLTGEDLLQIFLQPETTASPILGSAIVRQPWLRIVGSLKPSEKIAGVAMAHWIYEQYGLKTVMIAEWNGIDTPGFDAVLVNESDEPVANLSLKELSSGTKGTFLHQVDDGLRQLHRYSQPKLWAEFLLSRILGLPIRPGILNETFILPNERSETLFEHNREQLLQLSHFLGVGTSRPTWLAVHVLPAAQLTVPQSYLAQSSFRSQSAGDLQKILVLFANKGVEVTKSKIQVKQLHSCALDLISNHQ